MACDKEARLCSYVVADPYQWKFTKGQNSADTAKLLLLLKKTCIRAIKHLSTNADSITDTKKNPANKRKFAEKQTFLRAAILHPL